MEERTRLGRGLEEISQLYLSERPREAAPKEKKPDPPVRSRQVVRVLSPGPGAVKAAFVANIALELARSRCRVSVWDIPSGERAGVRDMLGALVRPGLTPDAGAVNLYGLPDILVHYAEEKPKEALEELIEEGSFAESDRYLLISAPDSVESLLRITVPSDAILLSAVDEASLLKCYAWIKLLLERDPLCRIHIAFCQPVSQDKARDLFTRLAGFVKERHQGSLSFLGCLIQDPLFQRSMDEQTPLVMYRDSSVAKDSLTAVCAAFLNSRPASPER